MCLPATYLNKILKINHDIFPGNSTHQLESGFQGRPASRSNWNLEMLVFEERGKPEYPEKNLSEQSTEPRNSVHL